MALDPKEVRVESAEDKPRSGMWPCGPNPSWVTVTHLPTMISARMFDGNQHKARNAAMACVEMMVEQSIMAACHYPENLRPPTDKEPQDD